MVAAIANGLDAKPLKVIREGHYERGVRIPRVLGRATSSWMEVKLGRLIVRVRRSDRFQNKSTGLYAH